MKPQRKPQRRCWHEWHPAGDLRFVFLALETCRGYPTRAKAAAGWPGKKLARYKVTVEEI